MRRFALVAALVLALPFGASAQDLEGSLDRFAAAWTRGSAGGVAQLAASDGMVIELHGDAVGPLGHRQAAGLLKRVLDDLETHSLRADLARNVGGEPLRAYAELTWVSRMKGTSIPETRRIFLALLREDAGWRITQIRVLR